MVQDNFFPDESRLCAFSQLQQDKINGSVFPVTKQGQTLGLQAIAVGGADQFRQPFRFVDQEKSPPYFRRREPHRNRSSGQQLPSCRAVLRLRLEAPPEK